MIFKCLQGLFSSVGRVSVGSRPSNNVSTASALTLAIHKMRSFWARVREMSIRLGQGYKLELYDIG